MLYLYQDKGKAITKTKKYIAAHNHTTTQRKVGKYMNDTSKNYDILATMIDDLNLTAENILQAFTNYHGMQLMTDDFMQFINDEYMPDNY